MKKKTMRIVSWVIIVIVLVTFLAFVLIPKNLPPVAEIPEEPDLVEPGEPAEPIEPNPIEPVKPKLVSFSEKGAVRAEVGNTSATIVCRMPEGTRIVLDMKTVMLERVTYSDDKPQEEYCLIALVNDNYGLFFLGINPTAELSERLGPTHVAGNPDSIEVAAGTVLGTVGYPLENDWGLEGCNLVIIVAANPETAYIIEPSVASILEAITR